MPFGFLLAIEDGIEMEAEVVHKKAEMDAEAAHKKTEMHAEAAHSKRDGNFG